VTGVGSVPMPVVDVVGVVAVLDTFVAAIRTVLMGMLVVHDVRLDLALVVVPIVGVMSVTVMQIVRVVGVLDSHVAAARPVLMVVLCVLLAARVVHSLYGSGRVRPVGCSRSAWLADRAEA
jgi:hypothetical protein